MKKEEEEEQKSSRQIFSEVFNAKNVAEDNVPFFP